MRGYHCKNAFFLCFFLKFFFFFWHIKPVERVSNFTKIYFHVFLADLNEVLIYSLQVTHILGCSNEIKGDTDLELIHIVGDGNIQLFFSEFFLGH